MERKSYMKRALEIADIKAKYDAEVKKYSAIKMFWRGFLNIPPKNLLPCPYRR